MGSRFDILQEEHVLEAELVVNEICDNHLKVHTTKSNFQIESNKDNEAIVILDDGEGCSKGVRDNLLRKISNTHMKLDKSKEADVGHKVSDFAKDEIREIVSNERITDTEISLDKEKHTAVRVGIEKSTLPPKISEGRGASILNRGGTKIQAKTVTAFKGNQRQSSKIRKNDDTSKIKQNLASRVSSIVSDLDKVAFAEDARPGNSDQQHINVHWCENGTFMKVGNDQGPN
ncbi:hypothetical protein V6N11_024609 [Hibiscus sabdariffa]|uniref:Uncharacterized protein n=1 Tax=Hibiscus sabdariffa TaxID=183260 RepID=A0ABR2QMX5_9ROSI